MRILVVSHEFPPLGGGGANACYYLTKGYVKAENEVTIVTAHYEGLPYKEIINGAVVLRVRAKRKNKEYCSFGEMVSYLLSAFPVVNKLLKQQKFDVCQVFFGIPSGPLGYWVKKKYKVPYVIRFGGGDIPGAQARFDKVYRLIAPMIKLIWRNADNLVANSEGLRQRAYDFYDKKEIEIITNGVDTDYFTPLEGTRNKINLLFVSRLLEGKGLQFLLPQMRQIISECDAEVCLTIVGDGPYRNILENIVKEENISQYVSFEGYKSKEQVIGYYQNADIFLLPSEKEGMPNVVLEAMACGLPIVITPCEGSAELIQNNGVVVLQERFAKEIVRICNDKDLRIRMGNESRRMALEQFKWEKKVNLYLAMYSGIVK